MNAQTRPGTAPTVTREVARWIVNFDGEAPEARVRARHALLVTLDAARAALC